MQGSAIVYIKGCDNVVADALSRVEIAAIFQHAAQIDWNYFAKAQQNDYETLLGRN